MLSTPFEFQIVLTPKRMHHTESTTLALSLQKFPRTAVNANIIAPFYVVRVHNQTVSWLTVRKTLSPQIHDSAVNNALLPFHKICTPMHTSKKEVSCRMTVIPVVPITRPNRSANPWQRNTPRVQPQLISQR